MSRLTCCFKIICLCLIACINSTAYASNPFFVYYITTVAGISGSAGNTGTGGAGTSATLSSPNDVRLDSAGNLYIVTYGSNNVRKLSTLNVMSNVAGTGAAGYNGNGSPATSYQLSTPVAISIDDADNLYIGDLANNLIRKVTPGGTISNFAGTGIGTFNVASGVATAVNIGSPVGSDADSAGNVYIADYGLHRIRKVDTLGNLTTICGNGTATSTGDNVLASTATINTPERIFVDSSDNIYIATANLIRRIGTDNKIYTVAGTGAANFSGDGAAATSATISRPLGMAKDSNGYLFFCDFNNRRVRMIDPTTGFISTIVGDGTNASSGDGGAPSAARLMLPAGIAIDSSGNIFIADAGAYVVRKIYQNGVLITTGTFTINAASDLGTGNVTIVNGFLKTGAAMTVTKDFAFTGTTGGINTNGFDSTYSGALSGSGVLTKTGTGKPH